MKILTCYFNGQKDTQRDIYWEADIEKLRPLAESTKDYELIVFTDCLTNKPKEWEHVRLINGQIRMNPYFARWSTYHNYLTKNPSIEDVWFVDATDVTMLKKPFEFKEDIIYVGSEADTLGCDWMLKSTPYMEPLFKGSKLPLYNIGLLGGKTDILIPLLFDTKILYMSWGERLGLTDMGVFNFLLHTKYRDVVETGKHIHTHFAKYEKDNKVATWQHK